MKYFLAFILLFGAGVALAVEDGYPNGGYMEERQEVPQYAAQKEMQEPTFEFSTNKILKANSQLRISVVGQGVAPAFTSSPAQAFAMAKRAAMVEAYRLIAERINGVQVEGQDTIKNMIVQRSTIKANVRAMIRNAVLVETTFQNGMCEVEMEITLEHSQFN